MLSRRACRRLAEQEASSPTRDGLPFFTASSPLDPHLRSALTSHGCFLLELNSAQTTQLTELLQVPLFKPSAAKQLVEHRAGGNALPLRLLRKANTQLDALSSLGETILDALSSSLSFERGDLVDREARVAGLSRLLDARPQPAGTTGASRLTFLSYPAGADAELHTDRGAEENRD